MQYERRILVPYLENLLNLEMTIHALDKKKVRYKDWCDPVENYIRNYSEPDEPQKPVFKRESAIMGYFLAFSLSAAFFFVGVYVIFSFLFNATVGDILAGYLVIAIIVIIIFTSSAISQDERNFEKQMEYYYNTLAQQQKTNQDYIEYKKNLPHNKNVLKKCESEIIKAMALLDKAYEANIIPSRYRNLYAVSYLYEYFSTSNANDLDAIIQTLLLDSIQQQLQIIQQKLDKIVDNQNSMLCELQTICEKAEQIEKNGYEQSKLLARQEKNLQLQTQYLDMIEANTSANAYFSAATCFEIMNL